MNCNCKWTEIIIAIVILIFTFWQTSFSMWVVVIAAVVLLLHALMCKKCGTCMPDQKMGMPAKKTAKKKR